MLEGRHPKNLVICDRTIIGEKQNIFAIICIDDPSTNHPLSQAAACDGVYYQITSENDINNPAPGVLPI